MKRKVSICTLCASSAQSASDYLEQKLRGYDPEAVSADFGDAEAFADAVGKCACDGGIIVAAAPLSMFLNAKIRLLKLFSSKTVRSSAVIAAMGDDVPEKEKDIHSAIPEKAKAFVSADGRYSAFAKELGEGIVIFMPLDESLIDGVFASGLSAILQKAFPDAAKPKKAGLAQVKDSVKKVIDSGRTVAVSPCGTAKALLSVINAVPDADDAFVPESTQRDMLENESVEDYIAQSAKLSKETAKTDWGIGISDIITDENGEDYVVVCVADSERAKAARVFAVPGEEKKHLIAAAVIQLCGMLEELSATGLVIPDIPKKPKNSKTPLIIAIAAIAVAIIACLVIAFVLGRENTDSTLSNADAPLHAAGTVEENTNVFIGYHGGSGLEDFDSDAVAVVPEETTTSLLTESKTVTAVISTTKAVTEKVTKIITTVIQTAKTTKATTTKTTTEATTKATTTETTQKTTVTTTQKPETTTKKETTEATTGESTSASGKFVFKVYGYGHGVGMSQNGAIHMAKNGSDYKEIVTHYFPDTTLKTDSSTPATIKYGGKDIPIVEYLCRSTKPEIGASAPLEALKAQIVAIYTYAKHYGFEVRADQHVYDEDYAYEGTNIHKACLAVLGMESDDGTPAAQYVDYNGSAAFTCYYSTSAGKTASASSVWGGTKYPYLAGGVSSPEDPKATEFEISAEDMKKLIGNYASEKNLDMKLGDNPAEWLKIVSHDGCRGESCGYVTTMRVGNYEMRGNAFRANVMKYKIRSHCFTFEYIPA